MTISSELYPLLTWECRVCGIEIREEVIDGVWEDFEKEMLDLASTVGGGDGYTEEVYAAALLQFDGDVDKAAHAMLTNDTLVYANAEALLGWRPTTAS